jgi:polygalacturonase
LKSLNGKEESAVNQTDFINILDFGAVPDGRTLCTDAFSAAVAACEKKGGGTIFVPAGNFLTGAIRLESNMTLLLEAGARLLFSDHPDGYPVVNSRWEGVSRKVHMSCVYAENAENVAVVGRGVLDGQGEAWWKLARSKMLDYPRPKLISFHHCRNVQVRDLMLVNSPGWTINPIECDGVTVTGVTIRNPADSPNTDGIDPDSCQNIHISNCHIDVGDDCIAVKSGTEASPQRIETRNVTITNCTMVHGHGGVVLGSEMSGGIRNVVVSNCVFEKTDRGIRIKSRRGRGGAVEDIRVQNLVMDGVLCPFICNLYYYCGPGGKEQSVRDKKPHPVTEATPVFRRIHFSNITARNVRAAAGFFYGLAEMPVEDVTLDNISVAMQEGAQPGMPDMLADFDPVSQMGFFCCNVKDFVFRNVTVSHPIGPAFSVENGENIQFSDCRVREQKGPAPLEKLVNVTD